MPRQINREGLEHIKRWEGKRLTAYLDVAGVWTIGYGSTGPHVRPGVTISDVEAEKLLIRDLSRFEAAVDRLVKVPLTDNQFAALVSFAFNVGEGALAKSTLLRKLNAGDYDAVPRELMKWVHAGGKRVQGLVNRRAAEGGLWAKGAHVSSKDIAAAPERLSLLTAENAARVTTGRSGLLQAVTSGPAQIILVVAFVLGAVYLAWRWHRSQQEAAS